MAKKTINKKIISQQSKYEWIWYVLSYLSIARISLEKLKIDQYPKKTIGDKAIYFDKFVLIAVIWSIKHAIELIIKSLGIMIDKAYLQSHDCKMLARDLREKLKPLNIYKTEKIDELDVIIDKYYRLEFLNKKLITSGSLCDIKNDIFRYPNNFLDIGFVNSITLSEINEILKDIEILRRLRAIMDVQLQIAKPK